MSTTGAPLQSLRATATDMTLLLGAESYIKSPRAPLDPRRQECLENFIDLMVNSETMHFTLPKNADGDPGLLRTGLRDKLQPFKGIEVVLTPETEQKVFDEFEQLVSHEVWVNDWIKFQLLNPIVTKGHADRIGERNELLSAVGLKAWHARRDQFRDKRGMLHFPPVLRERQIGAVSCQPDRVLSRGQRKCELYWCTRNRIGR